MTWTILQGDCVEQMKTLPDASIDAICTDPPYGLGFMGKAWDSDFEAADMPMRRSAQQDAVNAGAARQGGRQRAGLGYQRRMARDSRAFGAWCEEWAREALRVLKPGGHLLAFGGTRTYHRLAAGIEDAGFEIRDTIAWMYGQGFPKSLNVGCRCGDGEPTAEHDLRAAGMRAEDVPAAVDAGDERERVLLAGVSERDASAADGTVPAARGAGSPERVLEGRRDVQAPEGEPRGSALREGTDVGAADGASGRLPDGAPARDGDALRLPADQDGGRAPSRSRSAEQRADESGAVAGQPVAQVGGAWPTCGRCGMPTAGLGTALKPSHEPIVVARKPLDGTVASTVLRHGTGALHIDATRIHSAGSEGQAYTVKRMKPGATLEKTGGNWRPEDGEELPWEAGREFTGETKDGRWPANVVLSHSEGCVPIGTRRVKRNMIESKSEPSQNTFGDGLNGSRSAGYVDETVTAWRCVPGCPVRMLDEQTGTLTSGKEAAGGHRRNGDKFRTTYGAFEGQEVEPGALYGDSGGPSRFFANFEHRPEPGDLRRAMYVAKASSAERNAGLDGFEASKFLAHDNPGRMFNARDGGAGDEEAYRPKANVHPTVKPVELMRWLIRLVTPPGGTVLDPFLGSGTTGCAAVLEPCVGEFIGIERDEEYVPIARARIAWWAQHPDGIKLTQRLEAEAARKTTADAGQIDIFSALGDAA